MEEHGGTAVKVIAQRESIELCTEAGWSAYDLLTDEPVGREDIMRLGQLGTLTYLSSLKQPFYRVEGRHWLIKGLEGKKVLRVSMADTEEQILRHTYDQLEETDRF